PRWAESERLAREKEILGFFISGHPLDRYRDEVRVFEHVNTSTLKQFRDQKVELACVVTQVSRQISRRNGAEWGRIQVEDFRGTAAVLAFGDVWDQYHDLIVQDAPVLIRGQVSGRDRDEDDPPIFLDSVLPLPPLREGGALGVEIALNGGTDTARIDAASRVMQAHPGQSAVLVVAEQTENGAAGVAGTVTLRLRSRTLQVQPNDMLLEELRQILGGDSVRLIKA